MHALIACYFWPQVFDQGIENPRVGGSIPPPGTTQTKQVDDFIYLNEL